MSKYKEFRLIFTRQASEEIIQREFHALEDHLLKLHARTNVSRRGGLAIIDAEVPLSLAELRVEIERLGLAANIAINE